MTAETDYRLFTEVSAVLTGKIGRFGPNGEPSGIRKVLCDDKVRISMLGIEGDEQADLEYHGGIDKAIHHYPFDHYPTWIADRPELAAHLAAPGAFGENISTRGFTEADVCIGDLWRLGTALVEVSQGRQPCWKLGHRFGDKRMVAWVVETGRSGWYYRVREAGELTVGDRLDLVERPHSDWTVARVFRMLIGGRGTPEEHRQLSEVSPLAVSWKARIRL